MTDKITIKGTAPKYDEQVLKQLQEARHNAYDQTDECTTLVRGEIPIQFLSNVIDYHNKGFTLSMKYPVSVGSGSYSCRMEKPASIKIAELQALDDQMKIEYIAAVEAEREDYRKQLTAQLLQAAELAEAKKVADKKAKLLAEITKEVNDVFGDLVIPD